MTNHRFQCLWVCLLGLLLAPAAHAAEPTPTAPAEVPAAAPTDTTPSAEPVVPSDEETSTADAAERLHDLARTAYRAKDLPQAISYWREAHRLAPSWKYAYNLAYALFETENLVEAWNFIGEAEALGMPPRFLDKLGLVRSKIKRSLEASHAFVELIVLPSDAVVMFNGRLWNAPRRRWVDLTTSTVRVSREGYLSQEGQLGARVGRAAHLPRRAQAAAGAAHHHRQPRGSKRAGGRQGGRAAARGWARGARARSP